MNKKQHKQRKQRHIVNLVKEKQCALVLFYYQLVYANERKNWNAIIFLFTGHKVIAYQNAINEISLHLKESFLEVMTSIKNKNRNWAAIELLIHALRKYISTMPLAVMKSSLIHSEIRRMAMGACMRQNANMRMYIGALQADNQNRMQRLIIEGNWDVRKNELFKTIQQPIFPVKMDGYKLIKEKVEKKMQLIEQVAPLPHLDKESNDYN